MVCVVVVVGHEVLGSNCLAGSGSALKKAEMAASQQPPYSPRREELYYCVPGAAIATGHDTCTVW